VVKVSICIPVHNQAKYLVAAIKSALAQNFEDFEVLVSNNASTDDTEAILEEFRHPRLRRISTPCFLSMAESWNYCVQHAYGEYINLLSGDDMLAPDFIHEQCAVLDKNPRVAFVCSAAWQIDINGRRIGLYKSIRRSHVEPQRDAFIRFLDGPKCTLVSVLFRKSLFEQVGGFPTAYNICADWAFWLRLLRHGDFAYNERPLAFYRVDRDKPPRYFEHIKERFRVLDEVVKSWPGFIEPDERERLRRHALRRLVRQGVIALQHAKKEKLAEDELEHIKDYLISRANDPWIRAWIRMSSWPVIGNVGYCGERMARFGKQGAKGFVWRMHAILRRRPI